MRQFPSEGKYDKQFNIVRFVEQIITGEFRARAEDADLVPKVGDSQAIDKLDEERKLLK